MNPNFPIYVVSKGRHEYMMTSKTLTKMKVHHYIVVEPDEAPAYQQAVEKFSLMAKVLILDIAFKHNYALLDNLGLSRSTGPGPARNYAWEHSIKEGYGWHWVMDDNIRSFRRLNQNERTIVSSGAILRAMEDFCIRYKNIGMAGPQYKTFAPARKHFPPFLINTRIYSCNLIRNDVLQRWRGRYNEDTILSLDLLEKGWCTVQFNAFLQEKMPTQTMKGGNTKDFYHAEGKVKKGAKYADTGTLAKSKMLAEVYPQYARVKVRFGRIHHIVNYAPFKGRRLIAVDKIRHELEPNEYGMTYVKYQGRTAQLHWDIFRGMVESFAKGDKGLCNEIIEQSQEHAKVASGKIKPRPSSKVMALEARWYNSLMQSPDYEVYSDPFYLADLWACWKLYSSKISRALGKNKTESGQSVKDYIGPVKTIMDLGCGLGFVAKDMSSLYPHAEVYATNIESSEQYRLAKSLGDRSGFRVVGSHCGHGQIDLVIASEYFEHFYEPIEELRAVISNTSPRFMLVANGFGGRAIGHFDQYLIDGEKEPPKQAAKRFEAELKKAGYRKVKTDIWNSRPSLYQRQN